MCQSTCRHLVILQFGADEVSSLKTDVGPDESKSDAPNKPAAPAVCSSCVSITRCLVYSTSNFHFRRYGLRTFDGNTSHMQGNGAQMDLSGRQVQIIRLLLLLSRGVERGCVSQSCGHPSVMDNRNQIHVTYEIKTSTGYSHSILCSTPRLLAP